MSYTQIKNKMLNGTGVGSILNGGSNNTKSNHYIDSLQRFEKDFAAYDKLKRQEDKRKKSIGIERRREDQMGREEKRFNVMNDEYHQDQERRQRILSEQLLRVRKRANVTSLPYNPISLEYEQSKPGSDLKRKDEDYKIRNLVRAHNLDNHGSGRYNPVNGESRIGVEKLVPEDLNNRFSSRLAQHYEGYKIELPANMGKRRSSHQMSEQNLR